jgi:hypothetical protein
MAGFRRLPDNALSAQVGPGATDPIYSESRGPTPHSPVGSRSQSESDLLGDAESIVDLDAEIYRAVLSSMVRPSEKLDRHKLPGFR